MARFKNGSSMTRKGDVIEGNHINMDKIVVISEYKKNKEFSMLFTDECIYKFKGSAEEFAREFGGFTAIPNSNIEEGEDRTVIFVKASEVESIVSQNGYTLLDIGPNVATTLSVEEVLELLK